MTKEEKDDPESLSQAECRRQTNTDRRQRSYQSTWGSHTPDRRAADRRGKCSAANHLIKADAALEDKVQALQQEVNELRRELAAIQEWIQKHRGL